MIRRLAVTIRTAALAAALSAAAFAPLTAQQQETNEAAKTPAVISGFHAPETGPRLTPRLTPVESRYMGDRDAMRQERHTLSITATTLGLVLLVILLVVLL